MGITLAAMALIAARDGNDAVKDQVNLKSQVRAQKALSEEKVSGVRVIQANNAALGSSAIVVGGGTYPTDENAAPTPLYVSPVSFLAHASIPIDSAEMVNGKGDAINLVTQNMRNASATAAHDMGRAIFDGYLGAVEVTTSISAGAIASLPVNQASGLRQNKIVDLYQTNGSTKVGTGRVGAVTRDGDGTCHVAVSELKDTSGATLTGSLAAGTGLWIQGFLTPAAAQQFCSLSSAVGSADLYGTNVASADWTGVDKTLGDVISLGALRGLCDDIASRNGSDPDVFFMGRAVFQDWEQLQATNIRYAQGDTLDPLGKNGVRPMFRDKPIVVDDNCPDSQVFAVVKDAYLLGLKRELSTLGNTGAGGPEVSQTKLSYLIKIFGMMNGIVDHRNGVGRLKSVTITP